ncbi:MAG TPA: surface-adhesin E family protein [Longimicrobium sp.]|nr:surface-adhesin E family protein [Longimicrobium sp.]
MAAVITPSMAGAQRATRAPAWALITRTSELAWYVDTARIATAGPVTNVWLRYDYPAPQPVPSNPARHFSRVEIRTGLDCAARRATDLDFRALNAPGTRLVAEDPSVRGRTRTFALHPLGQMFGTTCDILEARRRGQLREMLQTLQRAPVPGRIGAAPAGRPSGAPAA